jgi:hypothetical protein
MKKTGFGKYSFRDTWFKNKKRRKNSAPLLFSVYFCDKKLFHQVFGSFHYRVTIEVLSYKIYFSRIVEMIYTMLPEF